MRISIRAIVLLCLISMLVSSCSTESGLTTSGSREWSRGQILDLSSLDLVAVASIEDTIFVAWAVDSQVLKLVQLNSALEQQSVTELDLPTYYPDDLALMAESPDLVHMIWEDRLDGVPTVMHAAVVPGQAELAAVHQISLPDQALHIETLVRPSEDRLDNFWSDLSGRDSGIFHGATSLSTGEEIAPPLQLTTGGWQPGLMQDSDGSLYLTWIEAVGGGHLVIQHARFNEDERRLVDTSQAADEREVRGYIITGPTIGRIGSQSIVAWSTGPRSAQGGRFDVQGNGYSEQIFGGRLESGTLDTSQSMGDSANYVMVAPDQTEVAQPLTLAEGEIVGAWKEPRLITTPAGTYAVYSGWIQERGNARLQIVIAPFGDSGSERLYPISATWQGSIRPDLAVSEDSSLYVAWLEAMGEDRYRVVVASTAPDALAELGGFRLSDWLQSFSGLWSDFLGLLFFVPYMIGWMVLPWGAVGVGTILNPDRVEGWKAMIWLWLAPPLHLLCKWYIAPALLPLGPTSAQLLLSIAPVVLGLILILIYWRRTERFSLLAAYGLFALTDLLFTLIVTLPRLLWN